MIRPRVFVSSVMTDFQEHREAARRAINNAGGDAVLVEDFPALPVSPRTACLDGVASCDVLVVLLAARGGWTAPSGRLVVHEEYDEAVRRRRPVLAFVHDVNRDPDAVALVRAVSDYVDGRFRPLYRDPNDLEIKVAAALKHVLEHSMQPERDPGSVDEDLQRAEMLDRQTTLRVVVVPAREDEFVDPVQLDSLPDEIYAIGHDRGVRLLSYEQAKQRAVRVNEAEVLQGARDQFGGPIDAVRVIVRTDGCVVIDVNVTGRTSEDGLHQMLAISPAEVLAGLRRAFRFAAGIYQKRDAFGRFNPVLVNAGLVGVGQRKLMDRRPENGSYSPGNVGDGLIRAFESARPVARAELAECDALAERFMVMIRRRLESA